MGPLSRPSPMHRPDRAGRPITTPAAGLRLRKTQERVGLNPIRDNGGSSAARAKHCAQRSTLVSQLRRRFAFAALPQAARRHVSGKPDSFWQLGSGLTHALLESCCRSFTRRGAPWSIDGVRCGIPNACRVPAGLADAMTMAARRAGSAQARRGRMLSVLDVPATRHQICRHARPVAIGKTNGTSNSTERRTGTARKEPKNSATLVILIRRATMYTLESLCVGKQAPLPLSPFKGGPKTSILRSAVSARESGPGWSLFRFDQARYRCHRRGSGRHARRRRSG